MPHSINLTRKTHFQLTTLIGAPATSMRRRSRLFLLAHGFSTPNGRRWQGRKGSCFHPNSLSPAVHGLIRCPCKGGSVTILLSGSPCGGSVAGPSSLQDQRPFQMFFIKSCFVFVSFGSAQRCHLGQCPAHRFPRANQIINPPRRCLLIKSC